MQTSQVLHVSLLLALCACVLARTVPDYRGKRTSDPRLAELQALISLGKESKVGHDLKIGEYGKRKRSDDWAVGRGDEFEELNRLALLQRVLDTLIEDEES